MHRLAWLSLAFLLLLPACARSGALTPESGGGASDTVSPSAVLGEYDLVLDPGGEAAHLEPVREATALGDDFAIDLKAAMLPLCGDCFQVTGIGLTPNNEVWVDLTLRHPFDPSFPRKQYEVFDVRAIFLTPLGDAFFEDTPAGANGAILAKDDLILNPDGYTPHFTERAPGFLRSTIHPYTQFFPDTEQRRMAYGSSETQRIEVLPPPTGWRVRVVLEASYVEAADNSLPPDDPGGYNNPVFFLPEGHVDEAFDVQVEITNQPILRDTPSQFEIIVTTRDWQTGASVDPAYPDLANPTGMRETTGEIASISLEMPVFNVYSEEPAESSGSGTLEDPRIDRWSFGVAVTFLGRYPFLVCVTDDRQPADLTGLTSNDDLRAFRIGYLEIVEP